MATPSEHAVWPGDVIHVNEDGWVLINRGAEHGVRPGMRLLVVGPAARELRDLFAPGAIGDAAPTVLRIRRTFELLEVVHVEPTCAVAVAARVPAARRPECYTGPEGELLIWVPLPQNYTWPPVPADDQDNVANEEGAGAVEDGAYGQGELGDGDAADGGADGTGTDGKNDGAGDAPAAGDDAGDVPPGGGQEDQRWEEALPLNGVAVGDLVVPAIPAASRAPDAVGGAGATADAPASAVATRTDSGDGAAQWDQPYAWLKSPNVP